MLYGMARVFTSALPLLLIVACGDVPTFPDPERDSGPATCGEAEDGGEVGMCPMGQVCIGGSCYAPCEDDDECASSQVCEEGVCVEGDKPDAGPPTPDAGTDSGPGDLCADVSCADTPATPVCHPSGECVVCTTVTDCGPAERICDLAYGTCGAFMAGRTCAPCSDTSDCEGTTVCTERSSQRERVCLAPCADGTCPRGFSCRDDLCEPVIGTCTTIRGMLENLECLEDIDCAPLGTTTRDNTCQGEDAMLGTPGRCRSPCGDDAQCPPTYTCDGMFCQPPVAM